MLVKSYPEPLEANDDTTIELSGRSSATPHCIQLPSSSGSEENKHHHDDDDFEEEEVKQRISDAEQHPNNRLLASTVGCKRRNKLVTSSPVRRIKTQRRPPARKPAGARKNNVAVSVTANTASAVDAVAAAAAAKPRGKPLADNHRLTEYFPVRRSIRKPKKIVLEERQRDLECKLAYGSEDGLQVKHFRGKGRGVVTTRAFLKGEFVVEYIGELIDQTTAKKREAKYAKDQNTGCYMYYFQHRNQQYCVDATAESEKLGRLVNHSRNGNLTTRIVEVHSTPHLVLIAKEDIPAGVEVSYDYGDRSRESIRNHPWLAL